MYLPVNNHVITQSKIVCNTKIKYYLMQQDLNNE